MQLEGTKLSEVESGPRMVGFVRGSCHTLTAGCEAPLVHDLKMQLEATQLPEVKWDDRMVGFARGLGHTWSAG